jgi:hypothetical protein
MTWLPMTDEDRTRACGLLQRLYRRENQRYGKGIHIPTTFPRKDLDWLASQGLAPNQRSTLTHDEAIKALRASSKHTSTLLGARAFVASLDSDGPPHGAFVEAQLLSALMPTHPFTSTSDICKICGVGRELIVDTAEQFLRWHTEGTGIPGSVEWSLLALEHLKSFRESSTIGTNKLAAVLHTLDHQPAKARASHAIKAVHALKLFRETSKGEISRGVIETLAFIGVLESPPHVGMATRFVSYAQRDERPTMRTELDAPLGFWTGANGVHWNNVATLFGLTVETVQALQSEGAASFKIQANKPGKTMRKQTDTPSARSLKRRPAEVGDVWGIRLRDDAWVMVYVWKTQTTKRLLATVEYLDWFAESLPHEVDTSTMGVRARRNGRWQTRVHSLEKTTGTVLVAERAHVPMAKAPDEVATSGAAKDLQHLADWCFPELEQD